MAKETDTAKLEARIIELENALKALTALRQPVDLSADEIKAYLKVRDAVCCDKNCGSFMVEACWVNCGNFPTRCRWAPCSGCGFPCSRCGCDIGYFGGGGLARFSDLGS